MRLEGIEHVQILLVQRTPEQVSLLEEITRIESHFQILLWLDTAPPAIKADREVVLLAVRKCGEALAYVSPELCADRQVALMAVQQDGRALKFASPDLCADRDVVLAAVRQSELALGFASPELRMDDEVLSLFRAVWGYGYDSVLSHTVLYTGLEDGALCF